MDGSCGTTCRSRTLGSSGSTTASGGGVRRAWACWSRICPTAATLQRVGLDGGLHRGLQGVGAPGVQQAQQGRGRRPQVVAAAGGPLQHGGARRHDLAQAVQAAGGPGLALPGDQGGDVGGVLDDGAPVEGPGLPGDLLAALQHAHDLRRGQHGQRPPDPVVRQAVVVAVEADVGGGADRDLDPVVGGEGGVGQGLQPGALVLPGRAHGQAGGVGVLALGDGVLAPTLHRGVQLVEVRPTPADQEARAQVADAALDAALLVAAVGDDRPGLEAVVAREGQQRRVEADGVAAALGHDGHGVVVQQDPRHPTQLRERGRGPGQEAAHPLLLHSGSEEAHAAHAQPGPHHDEG